MGSVLSYDILCHQENLSSPFPMDWMYKEHNRNEESSPDMDNQSSPCDYLTKQEDINETQEKLGHFEDKLSAQTALLVKEEGDSEGSSSIVGPITSNLDECIMATDSNQPSGQKDFDELLCDSSGIVPPKREGFDGTTDMSSELLIDGLEKKAEEVCEDISNEERTIKLLRQEVGIYKDNFLRVFLCEPFV